MSKRRDSIRVIERRFGKSSILYFIRSPRLPSKEMCSMQIKRLDTILPISSDLINRYDDRYNGID